MICPKCNRETDRIFTVGRNRGRAPWKPWTVKPATERSRIKLCKSCAKLEASARTNRLHAKCSPSVLVSARMIGKFLCTFCRPDDSVYRAVLEVTEEFYRWIESYEFDGSVARPWGALVRAWGSAETTKRGRRRLTLDLAALHCLLEVHDELLEGAKKESKAFGQYVRNLKPKIEALLP